MPTCSGSASWGWSRRSTSRPGIRASRRPWRELRELNAELEAKIAERTEELRHANDELIRKNRDLEESRELLVKAERLAEHGRLAGQVAHELNTPLGALLSAATNLVDEASKVALMAIQKDADLDRQAKSWLSAFVEEGFKAAATYPEREPTHAILHALEARLGAFSAPDPREMAEAMASLGFGADTDDGILGEAIARPELLDRAVRLTAPLRSAAVAKAAALMAAESIRKLGESSKHATEELLQDSLPDWMRPKLK